MSTTSLNGKSHNHSSHAPSRLENLMPGGSDHRVDQTFAADVFTEKVMQQRLPKEVYKRSCAPSTTASRSTRPSPTSWPPR